jgi:hypothetical protein
MAPLFLFSLTSSSSWGRHCWSLQSLLLAAMLHHLQSSRLLDCAVFPVGVRQQPQQQEQPHYPAAVAASPTLPDASVGGIIGRVPLYTAVDYNDHVYRVAIIGIDGGDHPKPLTTTTTTTPPPPQVLIIHLVSSLIVGCFFYCSPFFFALIFVENYLRPKFMHQPTD